MEKGQEMIGHPSVKNILKFSLPSVFSILFMSLYVVVDGLFVSNLVGTTALAAINLVYPVYGLIYAICLMMGTGGIAICATLLGRGEGVHARKTFTALTIVTVIASILYGILVLVTRDFTFGVLGVGDTTFQYATDYLFPIVIFFPSLALQIMFQMAFIAAGKPNLSFLIILAAGVTNMVLDYVFIAVFGWGIAGAGVATGVGATIPALIGLIYFSVKKDCTLRFSRPKFNLKEIGKACVNGSSEMVSNLGVSVVTFLFNIAMLNIAGDDGVAAITIILYGEMLLVGILFGFAVGISPVISFYNGQNNAKYLKSLFKGNMKIVLVFSAVAALGGMIFAPQIASAFTSSNGAVFDMVVVGMRTFSIAYFFMGTNIYASAMFTAYSNGLVSALISFLKTFVFTSGLLLLLPMLLGQTGVFIAVPIAELCTFCVSAGLLFKFRKKYMYG